MLTKRKAAAFQQCHSLNVALDNISNKQVNDKNVLYKYTWTVDEVLFIIICAIVATEESF